MKILVKYLVILFCITQCRQPQSDKPITKVNYYSNRKTKDSLTLNSDSIKNGKCFYFDEEGDLDSIVTFKNGKLNGLETIFLGETGTFTYEYKDDSLIEQKVYDSINRLIYMTPLHFNLSPKTTYKFKSNRLFFDQDKGDTITFINPDVPSRNRDIEVTGAIMKSIDENVFSLTTSRHFDSPKDITIKVKILEEISKEPNIPYRIDTITIPVK